MAVPVRGKLILDTSIFVSYLRAGLHENWVEGRIKDTSRFLSSIVAFELLLGAGAAKKRRGVIRRLVRSFPATRVVAPTNNVYRKAAELFLEIFGSSSGSWPEGRLGPVHDIVIAVTAVCIGATVVTENGKDFSRIASHLPGFVFVVPG